MCVMYYIAKTKLVSFRRWIRCTLVCYRKEYFIRCSARVLLYSLGRTAFFFGGETTPCYILYILRNIEIKAISSHNVYAFDGPHTPTPNTTYSVPLNLTGSSGLVCHLVYLRLDFVSIYPFYSAREEDMNNA